MSATASKVCGNSKGLGCGRELSIEDFHRNRRYADGRWPICKGCRCEIEQARYASKADDVILPQKAAYYRANRDEILAKQREHWAANAATIAERRNARRSERADIVNAQRRASYARRKLGHGAA